jgi:hypothetical protein
VHARLDATSNTIAITGKLVAAGTPWAGAAVFLFADTGGSGGFDPAPLGEVQTARDGSFSAHVPATQSEMITASLATGGHPCSGASTAPAGCLSETDTPPSAAHATVIVPRATDPKLSVRSADQARAQKSVLRLGDFPNGTDYGGPPLPCAAFRPKLSRLVATGDALSDLIYGADGHVSAFAHATVLRSQSDAHTDFNGVAQLAALRCETNELKAEYEDDRILSIGPLRIPRIGTEARAFRAQLSDPLVGQYLEDIVFIRAGRVVITLHTFAYGSTNLPLDLRLARALAKRAAQ